jgi:hypothetical protein
MLFEEEEFIWLSKLDEVIEPDNSGNLPSKNVSKTFLKFCDRS